MIWLWLALPLAAWVGILIFDFVEGKTYLHDRLDEWRLARSDLEEMDRAWAENPNRSDVVFSLTTIPSRLEHIESTLKTLLRTASGGRSSRWCRTTA